MAEIQFHDVSKSYGDGPRAVANLDLEIRDGEFMVFVGPSGCGKTTALRMVAGLEEISDGEVEIGGRVVNDLSPKERDVAMVFQNYALYPHMTVAQNLAFGLRLRKTSKEEVTRRVQHAAETLGLEEYLDRKPRALSGGQRQRVAMGRAIVREPQAFLMDEPLSNLDAKLRVQMRAEIQKLQRSLGVTTIYVTHDQTEAMTMGDRIAVMRDGSLQQVDTPERVYQQPANEFVAGFIGSPAMNMVEARLKPTSAGRAVVFGSHELAVDERLAPAWDSGASLVLGIRPEDFDDPAALPGCPQLDAVCVLRETLGSEVLVHFEVEPSGPTWVARVHAQTSVQEGAPIGLAIDPKHLHFFDPTTGKAL
jgi:multiple sugar transport system ATP-binding protein